MIILKKHYPLIIAISAIFFLVIPSLTISMHKSGGHLIYILDDTYIHMAVAKNLVEHGVWGVTRSGFTSSSSSPLWILFLSLYYALSGVNETAPFVSNVIFALLVCVVSYIFLKRYKTQPFLILITLLSIVLFTPIPAMVFVGMEHILHLLITILFIYLSAEVISEGRGRSFKSVSLFMLAPVLTITRYEGLFLLFTVCALFAFRKRPYYALSLALLGMLSVTIYGIISVLQGWLFLPNSVLAKGNIPDGHSVKDWISFCLRGLRHISGNLPVFILTVAAAGFFVYIYSRQKKMWGKRQVMLAIFVITVFLHMQFSFAGSFYRYEAYLVGSGFFVIGAAFGGYVMRKPRIIKEQIPVYTALLLLAALIAMPFIDRGYHSLNAVPSSTHYTYLKNLTPVSFVKQYYPDATIVIYELGAFSFYTENKTLDILCLGNRETIPYLRKPYEKNTVRDWAEKEGAILAYIPANWTKYPLMLSEDWVMVSTWKCSGIEYEAESALAWYCTRPEYKEAMIRNLKDFSKKLPVDIEQKIFD